MNKNRAIVETFLTKCVNDDINRIDEFVSENYIGHDFPGVGDIHGPAEFAAFFESLREAFGDMEVITKEIISESDKVVVRATVYGTHTGTFCGIEPTGKPIEMNGIRIFRIKDGKIAEIWLTLGVAEVFEQIGVLPDSITL